VQEISHYFRFCPDRVDVKISDAVCFGRRRANYPFCQGCQFNDDEKAADGRIEPVEIRAHTEMNHQDMIEKVFKAYDVRATYPEPLNEDVAWRIGHATALFFRESLPTAQRPVTDHLAVVVGRDMRQSSPALARALIEGIRASGVPVVDVGMIDTSQLYFAVNHCQAAGGIQTTASHNPAHYNGFKICGRGGVPVGENSGLRDICLLSQKVTRHQAAQPGTLSRCDLTAEYKAFVRRFVRPIRPLKVVVDASNGMAGKWAPIIFGDLPNLTTVFLNTETNGEFVHEPNPLVDANLDQVRAEVRRVRADFGVCFDGDADRCMLVDEHAEIVRCDMLTALLARYFLEQYPASTIVYDLRSSRVVAEEVTRHGGTPRRERVGHAFMKKALAESDAVFGGELSGHFYFRDNFYCDSGMLALAHVLNVLSASGESLGRLIAPLMRLSASGERNFETDDKDGTINRLAEIYRDAQIDRLDGISVDYDRWWCNVRKSNTEPLLRLNLEADSPELLEEKVAEVGRHLGKPVAH